MTRRDTNKNWLIKNMKGKERERNTWAVWEEREKAHEEWSMPITYTCLKNRRKGFPKTICATRKKYCEIAVWSWGMWMINSWHDTGFHIKMMKIINLFHVYKNRYDTPFYLSLFLATSDFYLARSPQICKPYSWNIVECLVNTDNILM